MSDPMMPRKKVNRLCVLLLALGLGSALAIFLLAEPVRPDPLLGDPRANKKYLRELRVIGGKANVLADEFQDWFAGLWHGRTLAGTVAVLTVGGTLAFRFVALLPPVPEPPGDKPAPPAPAP